MTKSSPVIVDNSQELNELRQQVIELKGELHDVREKQEQTYKMIENIATSQNDLETNVYKAIMKIYNKIEENNKSIVTSSSDTSSVKEKKSRGRDMSPISFQHRSNLP